MKNQKILGVCIPIAVGAVFYYILCPDVLFVKFIDRVIGLNFHLENLKYNLWLTLIRNYALDMLWAYALLNCIYIIICSRKNAIITSIFLSSVMSLVIEMLQFFKIVSGTFDLYDILTEMIAILVASYVIYRNLGRNKL